MSRLMLLVLLLTACTPGRPLLEGPGCHYVSCGDLLDGKDEPRCGVFVDGRMIADHATGQEALDFIKRNSLRTCEVLTR